MGIVHHEPPTPVEPIELCNHSRIEVRKDILIGTTIHAGTVAHYCVLPKGHPEIKCLCGDGYTWQKFHGEQ